MEAAETIAVQREMDFVQPLHLLLAASQQDGNLSRAMADSGLKRAVIERALDPDRR
ncbi:MAG: Clp protease N-terminal domain-containing protein [Candidatus Acidiferrales bacterium]